MFQLLFHPLVLGAVLIGEGLSVRDVFRQRGVDDEFFGDDVPGQFPGELVLVAGLFVRVGGLEDLVDVGL